MSIVPNSVTLMTHATRNGLLPEGESFHTFFESWLVEQNQHLRELVAASREHEEHRRQLSDRGRNGRTQTQHQVDNQILLPLIQRVIDHYQHYYRAKSRWAQHHILTMFHPTWRSNLEDAFLWIGGWRPNMAIHLLYSKSGIQLEARLEEIIRGLTIGDLGDLSAIQLEKVNELQREILDQEREITEKLAKLQETVADSAMVELSHVATEMIREEGPPVDQGRVDNTLSPKMEGLVRMLHKADELRLETLKKVVDILTPIQGVYFLIAAAELHLRVHEWGMKQDGRLNNHQVEENGHARG